MSYCQHKFVHLAPYFLAVFLLGILSTCAGLTTPKNAIVGTWTKIEGGGETITFNPGGDLLIENTKLGTYEVTGKTYLRITPVTDGSEHIDPIDAQFSIGTNGDLILRLPGDQAEHFRRVRE